MFRKTIQITFIIFLIIPTLIFSQNIPSTFIGTNIPRGNSLKILRFAVSCTGEFTQSIKGINDEEKVSEVLKQMKNWTEELNKIYGREFCVRLELIPDNQLKKIIFTNASTDPWPSMAGEAGCSSSGEKILNTQRTIIDDIIGQSNYDISHIILHDFNGGCASYFKFGYSNDFNVEIARHEIGHQFQQGHTINNSVATNYEPENAGRSIQGGNSDPYAHSYSYHQSARYINTIPNVGLNVVTGNNIPTVSAGADKSIPINTPFTLNGVAADIDKDDNITFVWDQLDGGLPQKLPPTNDTQGALFSRLIPTNNPSRTFPKIVSILSNKFSNSEEHLPTKARELNFRLTVNDNHKYNINGNLVNASGINSDDIKITVINTNNPFRVTSQNNPVNYIAGTTQIITWDVSNTNLPPINTQNVKISLSTDGGETFPIVLLNSTPNNGTATIKLSNLSTNQARIKVEAIDNYFFSINSQNFNISQITANELPIDIGIKVYPNPNPNNGKFWIESPNPINCTLEVFDILGNQVLKKSFETNKLIKEEVIINNSFGLFTLRISSNAFNKTFKLMTQ